MHPLPDAPFGSEITGADPGNLTGAAAGADPGCASRGARTDLLFVRAVARSGRVACPHRRVRRERIRSGQDRRDRPRDPGRAAAAYGGRAGRRAARPRATTPTWPTSATWIPPRWRRSRSTGSSTASGSGTPTCPTWRFPPPSACCTPARCPEEGGDTGFCSQVMAAQQLPAAHRQRVFGREIKHDSTYASSGILRPGMTVPASPIEAVGHPHPTIRRIPGTRPGGAVPRPPHQRPCGRPDAGGERAAAG